MSDKFRDDALTLASFGVVAFAVADQTHEALGHGLATLITGGKLIALTTCYLNSVGGSERWIPASGGLANLAVGMIALALLPILPKPSPQMRYFLVLVVAFNLFFAAGYPVYSGIALFGDWAAVISGLAPAWLWRTLLAIIGVASYYLSMQFVARVIRPFGSSSEGPTRDRLRRITLIPFLAAVGLAFLGGLPNPRGWAMVFSAAVPAAALPSALHRWTMFPRLIGRIPQRQAPNRSGGAFNGSWLRVLWPLSLSRFLGQEFALCGDSRRSVFRGLKSQTKRIVPAVPREKLPPWLLRTFPVSADLI